MRRGPCDLQIEAARIAMMRHIKRGGKVWIRVFPDHPVTAKPLETRQGSGKGAPVGWCAPVKPGRILYEIKGVSLELAKEALTRAAHKLPVKAGQPVLEVEKPAGARRGRHRAGERREFLRSAPARSSVSRAWRAQGSSFWWRRCSAWQSPRPTA